MSQFHERPDASFNLNASKIYREGLLKPRDEIRQWAVHAELTHCLDEIITSRGDPAGSSLRILDIGCGSGAQALWSAIDGHKVVGLEPDANMRDLFGAALQALAEQTPEIGERVTIINARGEDAPEIFGPKRFDAVYAHGVLGYHSPEAQLTLLDAMREVLEPDGIVSLLNVNGGLAPAAQLALLQNWEEAHAALQSGDSGFVERQGVHIRTFSPDERSVLLLAAGFTKIRDSGVRTLTDHLITEPLKGNLETIREVDSIIGHTALGLMSAFVHTIGRPDPSYESGSNAFVSPSFTPY